MLDSGLPLATETNILKELIKPPNLLRKVTNLVKGDSTKYIKILFKKQNAFVGFLVLAISFHLINYQIYHGVD
jgi:hypothetical protein